MGKQNLMNKRHCFLLTRATTLVAISVELASNSSLLLRNLALIAAKVAVLDGVFYPELRFIKKKLILIRQ